MIERNGGGGGGGFVFFAEVDIFCRPEWEREFFTNHF